MNLLRHLPKLYPLVWCAIAAGAGWTLFTRLKDFSWQEIPTALAQVSAESLALALLCCFAAFATLSVYEIFAVRSVSRRLMIRTAWATSWIAHSIGHVIGAALLSGGALRYRSYSAAGLSSAEVAAVTAMAAMPYVLGLGWLLDLALLWFAPEAARALQLPLWSIVLLGIAGLIKDCAWLYVVRRRRHLKIGTRVVALPSPRHTALQIIVGIIEVSLVAAILYCFLPEGHGVAPLAFVAIFLIAATVAQLSHVPAGLGVLEAALLLLLPQVPETDLLAAILCYRAVFEVMPLMIGLGLLIHMESRRSPRAPREYA